MQKTPCESENIQMVLMKHSLNCENFQRSAERIGIFYVVAKGSFCVWYPEQ